MFYWPYILMVLIIAFLLGSALLGRVLSRGEANFWDGVSFFNSILALIPAAILVLMLIAGTLSRPEARRNCEFLGEQDLVETVFYERNVLSWTCYTRLNDGRLVPADAVHSVELDNLR